MRPLYSIALTVALTLTYQGFARKGIWWLTLIYVAFLASGVAAYVIPWQKP
jgi:hypothetical protein